MGPKQAVGGAPPALAEADDPEAERDRLAAEYADEHVTACGRASQGFVDELVELRDTRRRLASALVLSHAGRSATDRGTSPMTTDVALGDSFTAGLKSGAALGRRGGARARAADALREPAGVEVPASTSSSASWSRRSSSTPTWSRRVRRERRARVGAPGRPRVRRAAGRGRRPRSEAPRACRRDCHLSGHLALPRPAPAHAHARGGGHAPLQRRVPRRPSGRRGAARRLQGSGRIRARHLRRRRLPPSAEGRAAAASCARCAPGFG